MPLPYSLIFRSGGTGEDGNKNACGLTDAYMRFLLAVQDYPQTFWEDGTRVQLTDIEQQIIEDGRRVLSSIYSGERCGVVLFTGIINSSWGVVSGVETAPNVQAQVINDEFCEYDTSTRRLNFFKPAVVSFYFSVRVDGGQGPAGEYRQRIFVRQNGSLDFAAENRRLESFHSLSLSGAAEMATGDRLEFRYVQNSGQQVWLFPTGTRIMVVGNG